MPPTARAMKAPFPQLRPTNEERDWSGFAFINLDTMRRRSSAQNHVSGVANLITISIEPFLVASVQKDRQTDGRMVVQSGRIVGLKESMKINVKIRIVIPQLPAV